MTNPRINYRKLLIAYMAGVIKAEGLSCLRYVDNLEPRELNQLRRIRNDIAPELSEHDL